MKHFTSLFSCTRGDVEEILQISRDIKDEYQQGSRPQRLEGRVLAQIFDKPSLRTRVSFEAAIMQLGGKRDFSVQQRCGTPRTRIVGGRGPGVEQLCRRGRHSHLFPATD